MTAQVTGNRYTTNTIFDIEDVDSPAKAVDPIDELASRFPVNSLVRHTDTGTLGRVAVNNPGYTINAGAITYDLDHDPDHKVIELVYVAWPYGAYWTVASYLELADDA